MTYILLFLYYTAGKTKRKYTKKFKPPPLEEPLIKICLTPVVNLESSFMPPNETSSISELTQGTSEPPQGTSKPPQWTTEEPSNTNLGTIMQYLESKLTAMQLEISSNNALVRHNIVLTKMVSKNIKTLFDNENFEGFLTDLDITLPVSTEVELRDLEMRCLDDEFRKLL